MGRAGLSPPPTVLWTLEPMLDVSGEASLGTLPPLLATAADKLRGSVFLDKVERGNFWARAGGAGAPPAPPLGSCTPWV